MNENEVQDNSGAMMSRSKLPLSTSLPRAAANLLRQAAQVPNTARDPLAKQKAIENATAKVRREYPQFFRIEEEQGA